MITAISPTSFALFYKDMDEFYLRYMSENKAPKIPQTKPMAVGSAFDAYVKAHIATQFKLDGYNLNKLMEKQVEPHNIEWARTHGMVVFQYYQECGALDDLMFMMRDLKNPPRMEYSIKVALKVGDFEIPITGKPDLFFERVDGLSIMHDWKVNGYMAKSRLSPEPGFINTFSTEGKFHGRSHKSVILGNHNGVTYNLTGELKSQHKDQLTFYGWSAGQDIGEPFMVSLHQCCSVDRVAVFRVMITEHYQNELIQRIKHMWEVINSGWLFRNMSKKDSLLHQDYLEKKALAMEDMKDVL